MQHGIGLWYASVISIGEEKTVNFSLGPAIQFATSNLDVTGILQLTANSAISTLIATMEVTVYATMIGTELTVVFSQASAILFVMAVMEERPVIANDVSRTLEGISKEPVDVCLNGWARIVPNT